MSKFKVGDKAMFAESEVEIIKVEILEGDFDDNFICYEIKFSNNFRLWCNQSDLSELSKEKPLTENDYIGQTYTNFNSPKVELEKYIQHKFVLSDDDKRFELIKAALTGVCANPNLVVNLSMRGYIELFSNLSVAIADETLKQLKENESK